MKPTQNLPFSQSVFQNKNSISVHFAVCLFTMTLALLTGVSMGQIVFEEGYVVDNYNNKTPCLIKNAEWKNSPQKFEYRLSMDSEILKAGIDDYLEFSVANYHFVRAIVDIDISSHAINNLSTEKEPIYVKDTMVYLRTLVEGKASLYFYGDRDLYFFKVDTSEIIPLIYKEYKVESRIMKNNSYKSQLAEALICESIGVMELSDLQYTSKDLVKHFRKYNSCQGSAYREYSLKKKRDYINLFILAGTRISMLKSNNSANSTNNIDFGNELSFTAGIDFEYIFPFNKNKWAFIFRPIYQTYKAEDPRPGYNTPVDYKSIELSAGIKHSFFITEKSKLIVSGTFMFYDWDFNSTFRNLEIRSSNNINLGSGYVYNNRYSFEVYYGFSRDILTDYSLYSSQYQSINFVLGIKLF